MPRIGLRNHKDREDQASKDNIETSAGTGSGSDCLYVVMRHFEIEHVAANYLVTYNVDGEQLRESLETISNAAKQVIAVIEGHPQNTVAAETVTSPGREEAAA